MRWIFLILASLCEICWFYCISYLNRISWSELQDLSFFERTDALIIGLALIGYAGFGVLNMILFAKAIQKIAPSVSFAVWTGLALAGIALTDWIFLDIRISLLQWFSMALILIGVIGIRFFADSKA